MSWHTCPSFLTWADPHVVTEYLRAVRSTRIQEELEKQASPAIGVLHKLMRTDDAALRGRILDHYLVPKKAIVTPDGSEIPLKEPKVWPCDNARPR